MFGWLKSPRVVDLGPSGEALAAAQLPDPVEPKVKPKQQSMPGYLRTTAVNPDSAIRREERGVANKDLLEFRRATTDREVIRNFSKVSPDLAGAKFAYLRTAITADYTLLARNLDGTFSREGTILAYQLAARFDVLQDYSDGFSGINSMRSNSEMLGMELLEMGACSAELVLGKDRLPRTIQPVPVMEIEFFPDKSGRFLSPKQKKGGEYIDLDIPTFFYTSLDQDLMTAYAASPLEPAIQPAIAATDFMNDLRRAVKRVVQPRLTASIDEEKFREYTPADVSADQEKMTAHMNALIDQLEDQLNGLNPEDALITFNTIKFELLNNGNITLNKEWEVLQSIMDSKLATGAKAHPSILGHGSGSQNVASTETMLFMKNAAGAVQFKLMELYSRMFTLAVRLFGIDVTVEFKYAEIDLRPDLELETFRQTKQERILQLWSLGAYEDEEAVVLLTGKLPPVGMQKLSGTMFHKPAGGVAGNPYSGTAGAGGGGGALNQNLKSDAPAQPKGPVRVK